MKKSVVILIAVAAFLLGYYLSAKVAASFVGKYLSPL
jgi:hypothetical protein